MCRHRVSPPFCSHKAILISSTRQRLVFTVCVGQVLALIEHNLKFQYDRVTKIFKLLAFHVQHRTYVRHNHACCFSSSFLLRIHVDAADGSVASVNKQKGFPCQQDGDSANKRRGSICQQDGDSHFLKGNSNGDSQSAGETAMGCSIPYLTEVS